MAIERLALSAGFPKANEGIGAIPFELKLTEPENNNGFFVLSDFSLEKAKVTENAKIKNMIPRIKNTI